MSVTDFETLDARIATALRTRTSRRRSTSKSRKLKGRIGSSETDTSFLIYDYFRVTGTHETIFDFFDPMSVTLQRDDVQGFEARWDEVLSSIKDMPSNELLKSL